MKNKNIKDFFLVILGNIFTLLSGVAVSLLLPKILSTNDYGLFKLFSLYITYISLLGLGFIDGIFIFYSGQQYSNIDKDKIKNYSAFIIIYSLFLTIIGVIISFLFIKDNSYKFIFISLSLEIFLTLTIGYLQIFSQAIQRFREYSIRLILKSILTLLSILTLFILYYNGVSINYIIYIIIYNIINLLLLIWYLFTYKEIISISFKRVIKNKNIIFELCKIGFPVMLASVCTSLILSFDRQFVSFLFPPTESTVYAEYSFAYSLLQLFTVATTAVGVIIFPKMKNVANLNLSESYTKMTNTLEIVMFLLFSSYFPVRIFINMFLPNYSESLKYFFVVLPGLVMNSLVTIVCQNFYKYVNENKKFLIFSLVTLVISVLSNLLAYYVFYKDPLSISIASVLCLIFWYLLSSIYLKKKYNIYNRKILIYFCLMSFLYYIIGIYIKNMIVGFFVYLIAFFIITIFIYFKDIKKYLTRDKK